MRKKLTLYLIMMITLSLSSTVAHAVPNLLSYQGKLSDRSGNPINGSKSIVFTVYDAASGGTTLWTETQDVIVTNGILNVELGGVTSIPDSLFSSDNRYLGIKIDTDSEMTPRQRIASGAYSFKSKNSDIDDSLQSSISKMIVNNLILNEQAGVQVDMYVPDDTLVIRYDNTSKVVGTMNTDSSYISSNSSWFSPGLKMIYSGIIYDTFPSTSVNTAKWSSSHPMSVTTGQSISASGSSCSGGCEVRVNLYAKGTSDILNVKPINNKSEFTLRVGASTWSSCSGCSDASIGLTDGVNSVSLYGMGGNGFNWSEAIKVRIEGSTAFVKQESQVNKAESSVNLSTLTGANWYVYGTSRAANYGSPGTVGASVTLYPIVYVNNSTVPATDILSAINNINFTDKVHLYDVSSNILNRYISLNDGLNFGSANQGQIFSTSNAGSKLQLKYSLGGIDLVTLPKVLFSIIKTKVQ